MVRSSGTFSSGNLGISDGVGGRPAGFLTLSWEIFLLLGSTIVVWRVWIE